MSITGLSESKLKNALKQALVETLQEKPALFHEVFAEVIEEFALAAAIHEGRTSPPATPNQVMRALRGGR